MGTVNAISFNEYPDLYNSQSINQYTQYSSSIQIIITNRDNLIVILQEDQGVIIVVLIVVIIIIDVIH